MAIQIRPALRLLCDRNGIDLGDESPQMIARQLPAIIAAMASDIHRTRIAIAKSAEIVRQAEAQVPNPGIERSEALNLATGDDPNSCFDSLIPLE